MSKSVKDRAAEAALEPLRKALAEVLERGDSFTVSLQTDVDAEWPESESIRCVSLKLDAPAEIQLSLGVSEATQAVLSWRSAEKEENAGDDAWPAVRSALEKAFGRFTQSLGEALGQAVTGSNPTDEQPSPESDYRAAFRLADGDQTVGELWLSATREPLQALGARLRETRRRPSVQEHGRSLDALMDVELPVSLSLGAVQVSLGEVLSYGAGSVVKLACAADAPVDVVVNGRTIAKGTVVAVDGKYAVRVSEILLDRTSVV